MTNLMQKKLTSMKINWCMVLQSGKVLYHRFDQDQITKVQASEILEIKVPEYRAHQISGERELEKII